MAHLLQRSSDAIARRVGAVALLIIASIVFLASVVGAVAAGWSSGPRGAARGATTSALPTTSVVPPVARAGIAGFEPLAFTVTASDGRSRSWCALAADTAERQAKGLMGQHDLGGYDAMLFTFAGDVTASFYMWNVPIPVSLAWFAADGTFLSASDMEPCTVAQADCPLSSAPDPYRFAMEVPKGQLSALGVGAGSVLHVGGSCG